MKISRIDVIGQNGNDGLHYDEDDYDKYYYEEPKVQRRTKLTINNSKFNVGDPVVLRKDTLITHHDKYSWSMKFDAPVYIILASAYSPTTKSWRYKLRQETQEAYLWAEETELNSREEHIDVCDKERAKLYNNPTKAKVTESDD
jgi:hypothetical protein